MVHQATIDLPRPLAEVRVVAPAADEAQASGTGQAPAVDPAMEAALEEARQQFVQAGQALSGAAARVAALEEDILREARGHLVDLAVEIARKVLMQEIEEGRYRVEPLVEAALASAPSKREIVVHLNPEDFERAQEAAEGGAAALAGIRLFPDPAVPRAQCRLETAEGCVEVAVEAGLERLRQEMKRPS